MGQSLDKAGQSLDKAGQSLNKAGQSLDKVDDMLCCFMRNSFLIKVFQFFSGVDNK
jgi:hypothetical protein